jgi:hypothetical protein
MRQKDEKTKRQADKQKIGKMTNRQKDKQTKKQAEKQKIGHCNEKIGFVLFVYNYAEIGEAKD